MRLHKSSLLLLWSDLRHSTPLQSTVHAPEAHAQNQRYFHGSRSRDNFSNYYVIIIRASAITRRFRVFHATFGLVFGYAVTTDYDDDHVRPIRQTMEMLWKWCAPLPFVLNY